MAKTLKSLALALITTIGFASTSSAASVEWCRVVNATGTVFGGCYPSKDVCDRVNKSTQSQFTCVAFSK
jgi:hypothetical protein